MAADSQAIQVVRFQSIGDARVPLPQLVEALGHIDGFRQAAFLAPREGGGAVGVLLWENEQLVHAGFRTLRERFGGEPPKADIEVYRVAGVYPETLPAAEFARTTTRRFPSSVHHAAWRINVADRIVPALQTLDGFLGALWGETHDGSGGFAFELWSELVPDEATHAAVAQQPVAASLDPMLLNTPVIREAFRVVATAPAAVPA